MLRTRIFRLLVILSYYYLKKSIISDFTMWIFSQSLNMDRKHLQILYLMKLYIFLYYLPYQLFLTI